jgi:ssDNA thymidine ADP-ribosyltransferase, DarT
VVGGNDKMNRENPLDRHIYHMTHIDNLYSIFRHGALLSKGRISREKLALRSIAYESVQSLRDRIFMLDPIQQSYRKLHSYVPFYFSKYPPMLYTQQQKGILNDLVFFVINSSILDKQSVLFTDGNASMQKLSRDGGEKVAIVPAIGSKPCQRRYIPEGPYGTNQSYSNIYSDVAFLKNLDWDVINNIRRIEFEESKRIRSAEVLIPDKLSLSEIQRISVRTIGTAQIVKAIAEECGLIGLASFVTIDPSLFLG